MKKIGAFFIVLLLLIIGGVLLLYLARNQITERVIKDYVHRELNLDVHVEKLDMNIRQSEVRLEGFKVFNPSGYGDSHLAEFGLIFADYDLASVLRPPFRISLLEIDLQELVVIRNHEGRLNLQELVPDMTEPEKKQSTGEKVTTEAEEDKSLLIDILVMSIDRVIFIDHKKEGKRTTIPVGMRHHVYENIDSFDEVARLILVEAILRAGLTNLEELIEPLTAGLAALIPYLPEEIQDEYGEKLENQLNRLSEKSDKYIDRIDEYLDLLPEEAEDYLRRFLR